VDRFKQGVCIVVVRLGRARPKQMYYMDAIVNRCVTRGVFHAGRTHSGCEARKNVAKPNILHG
jgi:hypothetical protein